MQAKAIMGFKPILSCAAFLAAAAVSTSANAALLDGNLDTTPGGGTFVTFTTGQTFGAGAWTVGDGAANSGSNSGSIDLIGAYWQAPPFGGQSVDLDGSAPGSISQNFSLPAGTYQLSFELSGNPEGGDPTKTVGVSVGNVTNQQFSFVTGSNTKPAMGFLNETLTFTTPGATTLTFQSLDASGVFGPVVGNISVTAVPEPATAALALLGLGAIGFATRRRRPGGMLNAAIA